MFVVTKFVESYFTVLQEEKNIGILYHFTRPEFAKAILSGEISDGIPMRMYSKNGNLSLTRNYQLASSFFKNDFDVKRGYIVRFAIDGTKLSNKYKIVPVAGLKTDDEIDFSKPFADSQETRIKRSEGESEEVVINRKGFVDISDCTLDVSIYSHHPNAELWFKQLYPICHNLKIPCSLKSKWNPIKEDVDQHSGYYQTIEPREMFEVIA